MTINCRRRLDESSLHYYSYFKMKISGRIQIRIIIAGYIREYSEPYFINVNEDQLFSTPARYHVTFSFSVCVTNYTKIWSVLSKCDSTVRSEQSENFNIIPY